MEHLCSRVEIGEIVRLVTNDFVLRRFVPSSMFGVSALSPVWDTGDRHQSLDGMA